MLVERVMVDDSKRKRRQSRLQPDSRFQFAKPYALALTSKLTPVCYLSR